MVSLKYKNQATNTWDEVTSKDADTLSGVTLAQIQADYNAKINNVKGYTLKGNANFNSTTGTIINHSIGHTNYYVLPVPIENPNGYLGEVWVENAMNSFVVKCSGTATTSFGYIVFE